MFSPYTEPDCGVSGPVPLEEGDSVNLGLGVMGTTQDQELGSQELSPSALAGPLGGARENPAPALPPLAHRCHAGSSAQFLSLFCMPAFHVYSDHSKRRLSVCPREDEAQGRPAELCKEAPVVQG